MRCPYCGEDHDKVIDSRAADGGSSIRRRRHCLACEKRFTTYEFIERSTKLTVIKKDGSRVPYDKQRIISGLEKACYKRPVTDEKIAAIADQVEDELFKTHDDGTVKSLDIGRAIAERLKTVDQVAYVRFASVYKQFRDLDELLDEVKAQLQQPDGDTPGQGRLF